MKKIIFLFFSLAIISHLFCHIETERTIWVPWTIEHTREWETIEQQDPAISQFRRNEHFDTMNDLILRDTNWLQLRAHMMSAHQNKIFFPDLGFAILRKSDQILIGIIRTKFSENNGILSFSYGLRPEIRNDKLGQEIIKTFISYIDQLLTIPVLSFKHGIDRSFFIATWRTEGIKAHPDFEYLASLFDTQPQPLQKIVGSVDTRNFASLAVLMRHSMQPFALECDKYICSDNKHYFSCDFLLHYPSETQHPCFAVEQLAKSFLSRDDARIHNAHRHLTQLFHIENSWSYMLLSRAEKAALQLVEKSSLLYDCTTTKNITSRTYYPPYCFVK